MSRVSRPSIVSRDLAIDSGDGNLWKFHRYRERIEDRAARHADNEEKRQRNGKKTALFPICEKSDEKIAGNSRDVALDGFRVDDEM